MGDRARVWFITGVSTGFGRELAKAVLARGEIVAGTVRQAAQIDEFRALAPGRSLAYRLDVTQGGTIPGVIGSVVRDTGRIDVLVNNAGYGLIGAAEETSDAEARKLFETNFFGALSAMQAVIPVMRQQGGGTIINISSVAGHIPLPFHAAYSATKFALNAIGNAAGVELRNNNIHVLTVCPGYVRTAFGENAVRGTEQKKVRPDSVRGISAERVARATLRGYWKKKREVIVPWTMHVPVKLYQLFPGVVEWGMSRMAK